MNGQPRYLVIGLLSLSMIAVACTTHIAPYRTKQRRFDSGLYDKATPASSGSLFSYGGAGLLEDNVAGRVGDVLLIRIDERESASRGASSKLSRRQDTSYGVPNALGLMAKLQSKFPNVDPSKLLGVASSSQFDGSGQLQRKGNLNATLTVRVRKHMPNGDFYIEGTKVVLVGHEEHHIYVSGIVRRVDISAENVVLSSRIADAEIEYTGRGDVSDQQRQGWLSRVAGVLWPF